MEFSFGSHYDASISDHSELFLLKLQDFRLITPNLMCIEYHYH